MLKKKLLLALAGLALSAPALADHGRDRKYERHGYERHYYHGKYRHYDRHVVVRERHVYHHYRPAPRPVYVVHHAPPPPVHVVHSHHSHAGPALLVGAIIGAAVVHGAMSGGY